LRVDATVDRRKHELPGPRIAGSGVLARKRLGERRFAEAHGEIALVERPRSFQMCSQWELEPLRQQAQPILVAFALTHDEFRV
jgi:hypothetical protein